MLFGEAKDWKRFLSEEDEAKINEILKDLSKYRGAYKNSDDVKIAQIWCAIMDLKKQNEAIIKSIDEINGIFRSITERFQKKEEEKKNLKESLERF